MAATSDTTAERAPDASLKFRLEGELEAEARGMRIGADGALMHSEVQADGALMHSEVQADGR